MDYNAIIIDLGTDEKGSFNINDLWWHVIIYKPRGLIACVSLLEHARWTGHRLFEIRKNLICK